MKRLLLAGLLVLLGVGCWQGVELAKTLPVFNFTRLVLEGDLQKVPLSRMKEAVEGAVDGNFFTADLDHVRAAAERVPWVKRASVKRVWPGTLAIEVEVHEAMALYEDGRLVSTQGVLFSANPEEGREARDLPAFYGGAEQVEEIAERYRRFGDILAPLGARITDVILSDRGSWSLVFESDEIPPTKVELGQPEDEEKRAAQLAERSEKREDEPEMQARARKDDRHQRRRVKELRLREAEAHRIAHRPLHSPGQEELRDVDEHERNENFVRMEFVAKQRRHSAPEGAARSGGKNHNDEVPAACASRTSERGNAARNGAGDELPFRTDVPDIRLEADDEADGA